ncbi:MAG TPA: serine hydrolase domain-containing protein [Acidobacteriota bacterium]|nr:serine hydrolase domain-containing protein [Acidobacteriota bacterium]
MHSIAIRERGPRTRKADGVKLWVLAAVLASGVWSCARAPQTEHEASAMGIDREHLGHLDRVIESAIKNEETRGAVLLVSWEGQVVWNKAYGRRAVAADSVQTQSPEQQNGDAGDEATSQTDGENSDGNPASQDEPMTLDTVFDMASLTKVMATAPAVMILVEEGKIALTDRVRDYLPGFEHHGKDSIRLIHLLTHYSGLRPDVDLDEPWEGYETAIQLGLEEHPVAEPGERFIYSDINFFLLAEIVRRVGGMPFEEFCQERMYRPLGMKDTGFNPPTDLLPRIAPTEPHQGDMLRGTVHDPTTRRMGGVAGHAGLFSTAADVARFASMILNEGRLDGVRVLSPLAVRAMTRPQSPFGKPHLRGLGFDIDSPYATLRGDLFEKGSFGHTGFTGTSLWIDPKTQTSVILLTSRLHPDGRGSVVSLRKKVASVVAASLRNVP